MAEYELRFENNADGRFYVDEECFNCDLCSNDAPAFFREADNGGNHIVFRQPESEAEIELVIDVLNCCPAEAIGEDGPDVQTTALI